MTRPCECGLAARPRRLFGFLAEPVDGAPCFFTGSITPGGCGLPPTDSLSGFVEAGNGKIQGVLGGGFLPEGEQNQRLSVDNNVYGGVTKCSMKNFSEISLLEVRGMLSISLFKAVRPKENSISTGDMISSVDKDTPSLQILPYSEDYFYVVNISKYVAEIVPHESALVKRAGSSNFETVKLANMSSFRRTALLPKKAYTDTLPITGTQVPQSRQLQEKN